jgi:hypothetical protein
LQLCGFGPVSGQVIQIQVLEYAQIAIGDSGWAAASNAQREDVLRNLYQGFRSQFLIDALTRMLSCNHDEANNQVQKWLTEKKHSMLALQSCTQKLKKGGDEREVRSCSTRNSDELKSKLKRQLSRAGLLLKISDYRQKS